MATTVLLIASPGFVELSASCMMEIPALAPAVAALAILLAGHSGRWPWRVVGAGVLFGLALGMKLLGAMLLPLAVLIIWLRDRTEASPLTPALPPSDGAREFNHTATGRSRSILRGVVLRAWVVLGLTTAGTFVVLDLAIDGGDFLRHFRQTWASHFAPAVSFDYGSPAEHRFPPRLLLKNWDVTLPAALGVVMLLRRSRREPLALVPVAWLALAFVVVARHTPWWSYYYVHLALPLCWCAAVGYVAVGSLVARTLRTPEPGMDAGSRRRQARSPVPLRQARVAVLLRQAGRAIPLLLFVLCAVGWMAARVYLQVAGIRRAPQLHHTLVLEEMRQFKPFTEWLYADNLTYSFHAGIPLPPSLAVVSLKRLWSGELTAAGVADEVRKYRPGLIALRNDARELPFHDLLATEYRLVYQDSENRLHAHRNIANKPPP